MKVIIRLSIFLIIYFLLQHYFPIVFQLAFYPINILVTFFHELGHAFGSLLTGGSVHAMNVNPDGSGVTTTSGGSEGIILMGGYIGSAVFGNILFYCGTKCNFLSKIVSYILVIIFIYAAIFWLNSFFAIMWAFIFTLTFLLLGKTSKYLSMFLMFLGLLTTIYILKDFRVGPSSDLEMYEAQVGLFPASVWMYIWLGIVICLCAFNGYLILKHSIFKNNV